MFDGLLTKPVHKNILLEKAADILGLNKDVLSCSGDEEQTHQVNLPYIQEERKK